MQAEVEAFLQRIRAYPDDDAPRLVFADWLEEQAGRLAATEWGRPRAEFIRVQIALAHVAREDEGEDDFLARVAREEARAALAVTERALRDSHGEQWLAPFRGLATGPEFRRGFVEEVKVVARQFVRHAHELFDTGPIRHLHLLEPGGALAAVFGCPYLARLSALTVYASHVGEPLARAVAGCEHLTGLRRLRLTRNRFDDAAAEVLAGSPVLAGVEELDLSENELGETGARALAASAHLGAVDRLDLHDNRVGSVGARALARSGRLAGVRRLGLAGNEIGGPRLLTLGRAHDLLRVPELDLSRNRLTAAGLQVILARPAGSAAPIRLRDLNLSHNDLGDDGARVLAASPHVGGLRTLRLTGCGIGDDGARALAESPHLNRLVELDLGNNPISDPGFRAFLDTPHLRGLRKLVPGTGVSGRMRLALAQRFHAGR